MVGKWWMRGQPLFVSLRSLPGSNLNGILEKMKRIFAATV
jgi:hypothetical protein